jgi:hypothetical protein
MNLAREELSMGLFHMLFQEKKLIYRKRDKQTYNSIRSILKENNIKGISCGHYLQEEIIPGGCASQLDPRDLGPNGKIDRDIYYIKVPVSSYDNACNIIKQHGIKAEVVSEKELMTSAPTKARAKLSEINQQF